MIKMGSFSLFQKDSWYVALRTHATQIFTLIDRGNKRKYREYFLCMRYNDQWWKIPTKWWKYLNCLFSPPPIVFNQGQHSSHLFSPLFFIKGFRIILILRWQMGSGVKGAKDTAMRLKLSQLWKSFDPNWCTFHWYMGPKCYFSHTNCKVKYPIKNYV